MKLNIIHMTIDHWYFLFCDVNVKSVAHFFIVVFLLLICRCSLYILDHHALFIIAEEVQHSVQVAKRTNFAGSLPGCKSQITTYSVDLHKFPNLSVPQWYP